MFTYGQSARRAEDDDENEKKKGNVKPAFHAYEITYCAQHTHFYLSTDIGEPHEYTDMIHRILIAAPTDTIFIHLNTPGGHLDTGVQIVNAMQNSQAKIITVLESMAFSLGTLIFLAGDEMIVNDHCMIMFHNFRGGIQGKGNELTSQLEATKKWFSVFAKKVYVPFLTEEEFDHILRGEDLWMHSPEIRKRLDRMIRALAQPAKTRVKKKVRRTKTPKSPVDSISE